MNPKLQVHSAIISCSLLLLAGSTALHGQSQSQWKVISMYQFGINEFGYNFEMNSEEILLNEDFSYTGSVVGSTSPEMIGEPFSGQAEEHAGMLRLMEDGETWLPNAFVDDTQTYLMANSGFRMAGLSFTDTILGFRYDPELNSPLAGDWSGISIEVEVDLFNQLAGWSFSTYSAQIVGSNSIAVEIIDTNSEFDTPGSQFTLPFQQNGPDVVIDPGEDQGEFQLSASGDMMALVEFESYGLITEGEFVMFIKHVDPAAVTTADMAGTYVLHSFEFGKGQNLFDGWHSFDNETGYIELTSDGIGTYTLFQSSFNVNDDDDNYGSFSFGWKVENGQIVITEPDGTPMEDAPSFVIGASKQILKSTEFESATQPGQNEYILIDLAVRTQGTVSPAVKAIPMLRPEVDPDWASWYAERSRIYIGAWPWIHFEQLGWMRAIAGGDGSAIWLYDPQSEEYFFTDHRLFPWMISEAGAAHYFSLDLSTPDDRKVWVSQP